MIKDLETHLGATGYLLRVMQVKVHALFLMSRKNLNVQIFVVFILHTAGTYEIYENLHQMKISRYTVVHCHCYYTCIHSVFDHNFSQKSIDWGYSSFMKWKAQRVFTSTLHCTEYLHSGCSFPLAPSGCH